MYSSKAICVILKVSMLKPSSDWMRAEIENDSIKTELASKLQIFLTSSNSREISEQY